MSNTEQPKGARIVAVIVAVAFFMEMLDSTVLTTALPAIARGFDADPLLMNLVLTSYMVSLTAFIPASGKLADRFGAKRIFSTAIVVFTIGSILCSLARSPAFLIASRFVQGAGAAMLSPVGRLLLLRSVSKAQMVRAMSWVLIPTMIAPIAGPPIGGFFVTYLSWEWIFYINVPIGVLGLLMALRFLKETPRVTEQRFDYPGVVLSGITVSSFVVGLELVSRDVATRPYGALLLALGAASGWGYWRRSRHQAVPAIDFSLMRIRTFGITTRAGILFRIGYGAVPFLLPMMLQLGFGMSALRSGLITFTSGVSALVIKFTTVPILRAFGYRQIMIWNSLLCGLFLVLCALFQPEWPVPAMCFVLLLGGVARSLQFNAFGTIAFADVPPERMSGAISLHTTIQHLSSTLGVSISAAALGLSMFARGHTALEKPDFAIAFLCVASFAFFSAFICAELEPDAGRELSGHRSPREAGGLPQTSPK